MLEKPSHRLAFIFTERAEEQLATRPRLREAIAALQGRVSTEKSLRIERILVDAIPDPETGAFRGITVDIEVPSTPYDVMSQAQTRLITFIDSLDPEREIVVAVLPP